MSQWIAQGEQRRQIDFEILQESALAMAQATIQKAITQSGIKRSALAERMRRPRSFVSKMLSGSHNLTIKTFALALAACGLELQFNYMPIQWGWVQSEAVQTEAVESACEVVPTVGGQFCGNAPCITREMPIAALAM
jgi:plasmid maintenance system antidote protein VapI